MHKFLNTLKNIVLEINVLYFFIIISVLLFHGYSRDIFFHKLWLGLTRLMQSRASKVRTDL